MVLMTYAQAAVLAVQREMEADPRVVVMGEDVGRGGIFGQYKGLQETFGRERVIDTPISEAAIMGSGVGMALAGMRPVVEMRVVDFALCGMDEIVNQAAKNRYMFGGQGRVPLVARLEGTNVELGKKILADSGLPIISASDMADAAQKIVAAARA